MTDFIEIDFVEAGDSGSGDAIAIRRRSQGADWIYIVDGGYTADGEKLREHLRVHYDNPSYIDHVVLTHPDTDHASGLETVLCNCQVGCLWMNRPWLHVDELKPEFKYYQDRERLIARLKRDFPKVAELDEIANERGIEIRDAFLGDKIGEFTVLSPSKPTYLKLIVESDKTPKPASKTMARMEESVSVAQWGEENLKGDYEGTSAENESSIVQFADICGKTLLLTGDAGVRALTEAYYAAISLGIVPPHVLDWFQVPHHGSRRNLSTEVLDIWLGERLPFQQEENSRLHAIVSANQEDQEHPKKATVRALIHRGWRVVQTAGTLRVNSVGAPTRPGWVPATPFVYPTEQED